MFREVFAPLMKSLVSSRREFLNASQDSMTGRMIYYKLNIEMAVLLNEPKNDASDFRAEKTICRTLYN
jgi:hypothetical protein